MRKGEDDLRLITLSELITFNGRNGNPLWVLIDGNVYDITFYDHPGGIEVFDQDPNNYKDLYENFLEVGHSPSAERIMKKFLIGKLKKD